MKENKLYIAAAGAGKTTFLVNHAIDLVQENTTFDVAFITFTQKNQNEIRKRFQQNIGYIPEQIKIMGWYSFLLSYCIKPFMGSVIPDLCCKNVGISLSEGLSGIMKDNNGGIYYKYKANDLKSKYLTLENGFYTDKLSEFAFECYKKNKKNFLTRLSNIFSHILIDEVQDLSAWDYEIVRLLIMNKNISIKLCGDIRQSTYSTTPSPKYKKYKGRIDLYINECVNSKSKKIEIDVQSLRHSHRFGPKIAAFASIITGSDYPKTESCMCEQCKRKQEIYPDKTGVFLVRKKDVQLYIQMYNPLILIWDKRHGRQITQDTVNYGESKGMTVDVSLIVPTKAIIDKFLSSSINYLSSTTKSKLYVAVTRARYKVGIIVEENFNNNVLRLPFWEP